LNEITSPWAKWFIYSIDSRPKEADEFFEATMRVLPEYDYLKGFGELQ
jgi:hypothetical protein